MLDRALRFYDRFAIGRSLRQLLREWWCGSKHQLGAASGIAGEIGADFGVAQTDAEGF